MRDGNHSVGQLMSIGKKMLGRRHVLPPVTASLTQLHVEGTFPTGTHLVTVDQPISSEDGDMENALYGSFLPHPAKDLFSLPAESDHHGIQGGLISPTIVPRWSQGPVLVIFPKHRGMTGNI